ncbi:MAG: MMPL family transporter, partial [Gammaproteobacteria bacterium]|nr:MMPL family transporter [Gammaproteobacteria bacterium]
SWQIPYSIRVDSLSNFQHSYAVGDELVIGALVPDTAALHTEALARIRAVALSEPLLVDRLVAAGGEVTGVNVTVQLPGLQPRDEVPEVVAHARHLTAELLQNFPGINVHLTGIVMFNNAFPEATQHDMRTLVPAMFAVVILTLGIMLRIVSGILATLLVIGFSILAAMGARVGSACSSPDPPLLHPQLSSPWPWPIARTY